MRALRFPWFEVRKTFLILGYLVTLFSFDFSLTLLWYHGVNMTPGLFDGLNIPNFKIISFHLSLYFLCRFLSTVSIHSILISMLPFL